MLKTVMT